jgi:curli biogenesis system outer membrane secretion channel CsgG
MHRNTARTTRTRFFILGLLMLFASAPTTWAQSGTTPPPAGGPKKSIAVMGFEGTVPFEGGDAAQGLTSLLTGAFIKDGRFVVVERAAIADVSAEQRLTQRANMPATPLTPANALVRGTVTKFAPKVSGGGVSVGMFGGGLLGGALGLSGDRSEVEINLRLIDSLTGRILSSVTGKGSASSSGIKVDVYSRQGMTFGGDSFNASPLGKACEQAILQAIDQIAAAMDKVIWSAQVLSSETGQIYIAAGTIQNIQIGQTYKIYHQGMVLKDPATGAVIDVIETPVGSMNVTAVREKTSNGVVTEGALPQPGDIVRVN